MLGGMMLSKDAIADVVEVLRGVDFYKPAHESIYEAVISLYGRGEPADAITVADELTKRGEIERVGGPAYLHTLISSVPTAANAGFYAEIVRERGVPTGFIKLDKLTQGFQGFQGGQMIVIAAQPAKDPYLSPGEMLVLLGFCVCWHDWVTCCAAGPSGCGPFEHRYPEKVQ